LILLSFFKRRTAPSAACLPPLPKTEGRCGSFLSASRHLLAVALLPLAAGVQAESRVDRQIDQAVERYLTAQFKQEARRQGWQDIRFTQASTPLNDTSRLTPCAQPPVVETAGDNPSLLGRLRLRASCGDTPGWSVLLSTQVNVFIPALFAAQTIERGQTIEAAHLQVQELNVGKASRGYYQREEEVVGMGAKRRIRAGQALSPGLLASPMLVRRGQQVKIIASRDGIVATTLGEALQNGQRDEVIRVRNLSSDKIIEAKVLEDGTVTSTFE